MLAPGKPRAGYYAGTFDPPTRAHLRIMTDAVRKQGLARLQVVVNQRGTKKVYRCTAEQRAELIRAGLPADVASRIDVQVEPPQGKNALRDELKREGRYAWLGIIGYDSFEVLPEDVRCSNQWLVVNRDGKSVSAANARAMDIGHLGRGISSSRVRELIAAGKDASHLLSAGTARVIAQQGYYRTPLDEAAHLREAHFLGTWALITGARAALAPTFVPQQSPEEHANYIHRYLQGALKA